MWVTAPGASTERFARLVRISPASNSVVEDVAVGWFPEGVATGAGAAWVLSNLGDGSRPGRNEISRVDPITGQVVGTIPIEAGLDVAAGNGAVWVTNTDARSGGLVRIDPQDDRAIARIPVGVGTPRHIATGPDGVWMTVEVIASGSRSYVSVERIDPTTNRVVARTRIDDASSGDVAVGGGLVWVFVPATHPGAGSIYAVDPTRGEVVGTIGPIAGLLPAAVVEEGAVWAVTTFGAVLRIDPETKRMIGEPLDLGRRARAAAVGEGALWVLAGNEVFRIKAGT